jgi:hypothetical protein
MKVYNVPVASKLGLYVRVLYIIVFFVIQLCTFKAFEQGGLVTIIII